MRFLSAEEVFREAGEKVFLGLKGASGTVGMGDAHELLFHGTTDLAVLYEDGVVMATDGRATGGDMGIQNDNFDKMFAIDSHALMAISGVPGIGLSMARLIRAKLMFEAMDHEGVFLPAETKANIISTFVRDNLGLVLVHKLAVSPIMATFDLSESRPHGKIFNFWIDGTVKRCDRHVSCGSGGQTASIILDMALDVMKKGPDELSFDQAKHLAVLALRYAHKRDAATGAKIFMRFVTKNGIASVSEEEIDEISGRIAEGEVMP